MTKFENAGVEILKDETLSKNWYHLRNVTFNYTGSNGTTKTLKREVYDRGNGATILLYDPRRDSVVLVRQLRIPAYLNGHSGWLLETPAGLLDGDQPAEAIKREVMGRDRISGDGRKTALPRLHVARRRHRNRPLLRRRHRRDRARRGRRRGSA